MVMESDVQPSLIIEDGHSEEAGIEELCRHSRRVLWLSVRDGRRVVYKGLTDELQHHPEEIASLRKEYSLGLRIDCEGVVRFYGFEFHPQLGPIIVMEYVDGHTLHGYLRDSQIDNAELPKLDVRLKIAADIADSLETMHRAGILHRDLKPDNILIRKRDLRPKIIDLGHADAEDFLIYKNSVGTPQYGSPEQQVSSRGSTAGDIYSFGKILEILLPERRYRAIIDACISADESKRPEIKWVGKHLSDSRGGSLRWIGIIATVAVLLLVICFSLYFSNGKRDAAEDNVVNAENSLIVEKDEITPEPGVASATEEDEVKAQAPSKETETVGASTNGNIPINASAIVDKYSREADNINKRYGKLSYTDNIEENQQLRIKRGNEHYALSDKMDKELSDLGIDKSRRHEAYLQLWTYIVLETNRIDGVDDARANIMQKP